MLWPILIVALDGPARADLPSPVLEDLFPLGIQAGTSAGVSVAGTHLETVSTLRLSEPCILVEKTGDATFRLTAPPDLPVGFYDVSAVGKYGITGPRLFHVSRKRELTEPEGGHAALELPMNAIMTRRIAAAGEIDRYRLAGRAGIQLSSNSGRTGASRSCAP
ncbi:MAG: hypothetical protein AB7U20_19485 [Planctomycetaceae bacterium]